jgi:hypothetical protein
MIGDERRRQQPSRQFSINGAGEGAKPKCSLNLKHVLPASLIAFGVIAELSRIKAKLLGDEGAQRGRRLLALLQYPSWKTQITKHDREAKAVPIATAATDQHQILGSKCVVAHHPALIAGGSLESESLRLGEQFLAWHSCPC